MPKIKTKSGAAKRFSTTATKKVKRGKQGLRHILSSKTTKNKRRLRKGGLVSKADTKRIRMLIPYA